ncbi:MAG: serine/threonine protein kinase [Planctomycetes bacterium]|nr:serine/threonine protein kinase [Planctomycetota bacterium]
MTQDGTVTCANCGAPLYASAPDSQLCETKSYQGPRSQALHDMPTLFEPGSRIGKYCVVRRVAQGGCGVVYKAHDEQLQIDVAIKVPHVDRGGQLAKLLLNEARMVAQLRHPNIVRVLTADTDEHGSVYIVMDWIEGCTLRDAITEGRVTLNQAVETMEKVAGAVHAAHKAGYVHRDLKPANILIDTSGEPFVADFGLAIDESSQRDHRGEFVGTTAYMSPEQVRAESQYLDGRTDVWAIGVIFYELLCGRRPFAGDVDQVLDEICNREPKPIRLLNEELDDSLVAIIEGCLRKDVAQRTATARQVRDALRKSRRTDSDTTQFKLFPFVRNNTTLLGAGVLGVLLLVVVVLWNPPGPRSSDGLSRGSNAMSNPPNAENDSSSDGSEQPARAPVPLPGPSQRELVAGKWNKLLDRPLEKLLWPGPQSNSTIVSDTDLETLVLLVDGLAMLKAGQTDHNAFHLRVTADQPGWAGGLGVFFGLKSVADGHECECITLVRQLNLFGKASYRLDRDTLTLDANFRVTKTVGRSSAPIPFPDMRQELLVIVKNGRLTHVSWGDGKPIARLTTDSRPDLPPVDCVGSFGLYLASSSATFSQFRIFFD